MSELIDRQQAIDAVVSAMIDGADAELVEGVMELLPSAQPVNYGSTKSDSSSQLKLNNDLISRQMVIDAIEEMQIPIMRSKCESDQFKFSALAEVRQMISELPSAQPHGKWILETYQIRCSNCNKLFSDNLFPSNYCPNCGARMEGESDEML